MKFDYEVKHNGRIYPAGTDVPVGDSVQEKPIQAEVKQPEMEVEAEVEQPKPKANPKRNRKK